MKFSKVKMLLQLLVQSSILAMVRGLTVNRAPYFLSGWDMDRLVLSEGTTPGTSIYTLKAKDPEGSKLQYSISGEYFSVNPDTGVVVLQKALDREKQNIIEVIISVTDEDFSGSKPNTISLHRKITVLDENDNPPVFQGLPYYTHLPENTTIGKLLFPSESILVTDRDIGANSDISVNCVPDHHQDDTCKIFNITTKKLAEGKYDVQITLAQLLDYKIKNWYNISLLATDEAEDPLKRLHASVNVMIEVLEIQDHTSKFSNLPFIMTIPENTKEGVVIFSVKSKDDDIEESRPVGMNLESEKMGYFWLEVEKDDDGSIGRVSTNVSVDQDDLKIFKEQGIYTIEIRATELINGTTPGNSTVSSMTLVVSDADDGVTKFNEDRYHVNVPEDIDADMSIPNLYMVVRDADTGDSSKFTLGLKDAPDDSGVSFSTAHIQILDANDHRRKFTLEIFNITVPEDTEVSRKFGQVQTTNADSEVFGEITYSLRGPGVEKFGIGPKNGSLYLAQPLDFETQKYYLLILDAKDAEGELTSVGVRINVEDVNDNAPVFEKSEYSRIVTEGATDFHPRMYITATDIDGPKQGGGKVTYSIARHNSLNKDVLKIDAETGEVYFNGPARFSDTDRGTYKLVIRATDHGTPPKHSEIEFDVRVGVPGNIKPVFKGNSIFNIPGPCAYRSKILETAVSGTEVVRVEATDPDGKDNLLEYRIESGAEGKFIINPRSGIMTVSPDATLDLENNRDKYEVIVTAVDSGTPMKATATTTVTISVIDVNNKPPKFSESNYNAWVPEKTGIGTNVLNVTAYDPDADAKIEYSITEPIKAKDKTGLTITDNLLPYYDYKTAFRINKTSGAIIVNKVLDFQKAAVIILTIKAKDANAVIDRDKQVAYTEVTIFIGAHIDDNPIFTNHGWTIMNPIIKITVPEEQPLGTTLLRLTAKERHTDYPISKFILVRDKDEEPYVNVGEKSGNIVLSKRLDYETLNQKEIKFKVRALNGDYEITRRMSEATVIVSVRDINDNSPVFSQKDYRVTILESDKPSKVILTVKAMDLDSAKTEEEIKRGYGVVKYSLEGPNANLFKIDKYNGNIKIAPNIAFDREKQSVLYFYATATDSPAEKGAERTARALVTVDVLDVNDNAPKFSRDFYTATVPENEPVNVNVVNVTATDSDEGAAGTVFFEIIDEGEADGFFEINKTTGEILSKILLTGKSRVEPYKMRIRAKDRGNPPLHTDVLLTMYIGNTSNNNSVPQFIKPSIDEVATISEDSSIGSPVFHVSATDPDDPKTPNGKIRFKILDHGGFYNDASHFSINSETGLITTKKLLDREEKDSYLLSITASDLGDPPRQSNRILTVKVLDIDDHEPHFKKSFYDHPKEMSVEEEIQIGSKIGTITALDEDTEENGSIDYAFINGNDDGLFTIERLDNNTAVVKSAGRLDREEAESYLLTMKCFKYGTDLRVTMKSYDKHDPSETQIIVKLIDIDDNPPRFKEDNFTIGIRNNVPTGSSLITMNAEDDDSDALPINYSLGEIDFVSLVDKSMSKRSISPLLSVNSKTGEIKTIGPLSLYSDGYMQLSVFANNSIIPERRANATLRIFLLRDSDMLQFVFSKPPLEVGNKLEDFEKAVQQALLPPVSVNVYDQYRKEDDNSLDYSATSSCFQMVGKEYFGPKKMKALLHDPDNEELKKIYDEYNVEKIQNCVTKKARRQADVSAAQMWVLMSATLIGIATTAVGIMICCMHSKYIKQTKEAKLRRLCSTRPTWRYVSSVPEMMNSISPMNLDPDAIFSLGPHDGPYEWGNTLCHNCTHSR